MDALAVSTLNKAGLSMEILFVNDQITIGTPGQRNVNVAIYKTRTGEHLNILILNEFKKGV